jgi:hypothetical protein
MKPIKLSTSTNARSRKNVERWSSYATHPRDKYVRLRTDKTRDKCFIITCCQSVSFAACVRRHWLGFLKSNANFHQVSLPDRLVGRCMGA